MPTASSPPEVSANQAFLCGVLSSVRYRIDMDSPRVREVVRESSVCSREPSFSPYTVTGPV